MKNFVQRGDALAVTAPSGGVVSGQPVLIGSLFGVAAYSAAAGAPAEIVTLGVFDLPKAASVTFAVGDKVYFDATANNLTSVTTSNTYVGVATAAAASSDATVRVRLKQTPG